MIFYGIESGSQHVFNLMNKGEKLEQTIKAVRWTKKAGIEAYGSFILGFPGETKAQLEATINFHSLSYRMESTFISSQRNTYPKVYF